LADDLPDLGGLCPGVSKARWSLDCFTSRPLTAGIHMSAATEANIDSGWSKIRSGRHKLPKPSAEKARSLFLVSRILSKSRREFGAAAGVGCREKPAPDLPPAARQSMRKNIKLAGTYLYPRRFAVRRIFTSAEGDILEQRTVVSAFAIGKCGI
jgi:hypothetical protein